MANRTSPFSRLCVREPKKIIVPGAKLGREQWSEMKLETRQELEQTGLVYIDFCVYLKSGKSLTFF